MMSVEMVKLRKALSIVVPMLSFLLSFFSLSCDETLPPRDEPKRFLKASLNVKQLTVRMDVDSSGQLPYGVPPYPERISGTNGSLEISLVSYYNEVLQEQVHIAGTIDVWLADRPDVRTTVPISEADVDYPVFDPDGVLTLVPGDSVHAAHQWSHIASNGRSFLRYVPLTPGYDPATRRFYYESAPVRFNASATFQVFENVPAERTDVCEFHLIYRLYVILPP